MSEEQPWRQQLKGIRAFVETLKEPERDTTTIAGMFAEAMGCLEDAWNYLRQIDEQGQKQYADDIRLVASFGLRPCNPEMRFWEEILEAKEDLWRIQNELKTVAKHMPKEKEETR